jgi:flagellar hook-basal body complex protein FliE
MSIPPIPPMGAAPVAPAPTPPAAAGPGFAEALHRGIDTVSGLEGTADSITQSMATGGPAQIHDLMAATAKSQLSMDMLVQVRNRAVDAYQEIMRLQV